MDNQLLVSGGLLEPPKRPESKWDWQTILRLIALVVATALFIYLTTPS